MLSNSSCSAVIGISIGECPGRGEKAWWFVMDFDKEHSSFWALSWCRHVNLEKQDPHTSL